LSEVRHASAHSSRISRKNADASPTADGVLSEATTRATRRSEGREHDPSKDTNSRRFDVFFRGQRNQTGTNSIRVCRQSALVRCSHGLHLSIILPEPPPPPSFRHRITLQKHHLHHHGPARGRPRVGPELFKILALVSGSFSRWFSNLIILLSFAQPGEDVVLDGAPPSAATSHGTAYPQARPAPFAPAPSPLLLAYIITRFHIVAGNLVSFFGRNDS